VFHAPPLHTPPTHTPHTYSSLILNSGAVVRACGACAIMAYVPAVRACGGASVTYHARHAHAIMACVRYHGVCACGACAIMPCGACPEQWRRRQCGTHMHTPTSHTHAHPCTPTNPTHALARSIHAPPQNTRARAQHPCTPPNTRARAASTHPHTHARTRTASSWTLWPGVSA
jgi:hypothetical protein